MRDVCRAFDVILERGVIGETYNIGPGTEICNRDLAKLLHRLAVEHKVTSKSFDECVESIPDRVFNDKRYSVDGSRLRELGWEPHETFASGMKETFLFYVKLASS